MTEQEKALVDRCKTIAAWREKYGPEHNVMLPAVEAEQIASIALAALTAEPVPALTLPDDYPDEIYDLFDRIYDDRDRVHSAANAVWEIALAALTTPPAPAIPDGRQRVSVGDDEVLVALRRIEAYEDVDAQILADDAMLRPEIWPEWRVVDVE